ncbi:MAG: hypothetical protein DPW18_00300 [Chloroflexi bacterium]|jgi:hypothetical protein|nr:hypothetical protein [Anaerolineales bacterium]MCQ3935462.1 hypothetical protein [Chloroflexota bacterium]MDL1941248.1 thioredoxin family protein [Chloroflexi bacterium CFX2]HAX70228.1 hypothetical protein [Anaerolineae bacterium]HRJ55744.1 thioredoxin family protein [Anaerolineales bacterium]
MLKMTNTSVVSQTALPIDDLRWDQGLTLPEFVAQMSVDQEAMTRRLETVQLSEEEHAAAAALQRPIRVLVMTEDWCVDCLMNLPILARLTEAAPDMEVRVFLRSRWPDLQAWFAASDITSIPVFAFLDKPFRLIGTWVERSKAAHARLALWNEEHPEVSAIRRDESLSREERKARLDPIFERLKADMETWYAEGLQAATVREIMEILQ